MRRIETAGDTGRGPLSGSRGALALALLVVFSAHPLPAGALHQCPDAPTDAKRAAYSEECDVYSDAVAFPDELMRGMSGTGEAVLRGVDEGDPVPWDNLTFALETTAGFANDAVIHQVAATNFLIDDSPPEGSAAVALASTNGRTVLIEYSAVDCVGASAVGCSQGFARIASVTIAAVLPDGSTLERVDMSIDGDFSWSLDDAAAEGRYGFFTIMRDHAGNVEASPASGIDAQGTIVDDVIVLDRTPPSSSASLLSGFVSSMATIFPSATDPHAADGSRSGIGAIRVYRFAAGSTAFLGESVVSDCVLTGPATSDIPISATLQMEGSNGVATVAVDCAGNVEVIPSEADAFVVVDRSPPTSSVTALPSKSPIADLVVHWSGADALSPVQDFTVVVFADNEAAPREWLTRTSQLSGAFQGLDGVTYSFHSIARDQAGNVESAPQAPDTTVSFDLEAPVASISSPADGGFVAVDRVRVRFLAADAFLEAASCFFDERESLDCLGLTELTFDQVAEGTHSFTIAAHDSQGRVSTASALFTVDLKDPLVIILSPVEGSTLASGDSIALRFRATDTNIASVRCGLDGGFPVACDGPGTKVFTGLSDGFHILTVVATDKALRETSRSVSFIRDTVAPSVSITAPAPGTVTDADTVALGFAIEEANPVAISCRLDQAAPFPCQSPSGHLFDGITDGSHTVAVTVMDAAGRTVSATTTFVIDTAPPVSRIFALPAYTASSEVTLHWAGADAGTGVREYNVLWRKEGDPGWRTLLASTPLLSTIFEATEGGKYEFVSHAVDLLGHVETKRSADASTTVDFVSPTAAVIAAVQDSDKLLITVLFDDAAPGGSLLLFERHSASPSDASGAWMQAGRFEVPVGESMLVFQPTIPAFYRLRATAIDLAGNVEPGESSGDVTVLFDLETPRVTCGPRLPSGTLPALEGEATDDVGVASVEALLDGEALTPLSSGATRYLPSSPLSPGVHTFEFTARDVAGKKSVAVCAFTVSTEQVPGTVQAMAPVEADLTTSTATQIAVDDALIPVHGLYILAAEDSRAIVTLSAGNVKPVDIERPGGVVMTYFEAKATRADGGGRVALSSARFTLDVPIAWAASNGLDAHAIVILRHEATGWTPLPTRIKSIGVASMTLEADSPGFSLFAIVGDAEAPRAHVLSPTSDATSSQRTVLYTAVVSDDVGLVIGSVRLSIDGVAVEGLHISGDEKVMHTFFGLLVGAHEIRLEVSDNSGRQTEVSTLFTVAASADDAPPRLVTLHPADGARLASQNVEMKAAFEDESPLNGDAATMTIDGETVEAPVIVRGNEVLWAGLIAEGVHALMLTVADSQGNAQVVTWSIEVDREAHVAGTSFPLSGLRSGSILTQPKTVEIRPHGEGGATVTFTLDGESVHIAEGPPYSYTIDPAYFGPGAHRVDVAVVYSDGALETGSASFTVEKTRTPGAELLASLFASLVACAAMRRSRKR